MSNSRSVLRAPVIAVAVIGCLVALVVMAWWPRSDAKKEPPPVVGASAHPGPTAGAVTERTAEQKRRDTEINFVRALANQLKRSMKKPETFVLTRAIMIEGRTVCIEYTARNSFNDQSHQHYVWNGKTSSTGARDWNKLCANKSGEDYTAVRAVLD